MSRSAFVILACFATTVHAVSDSALDIQTTTQTAQAADLFIADALMPPEESQAEGAKQSKKNVAKKVAVAAASKIVDKIPAFKTVKLLAKGANAYAKVGWELASLTSKGPGPGDYPGFKSAVIDPVVAKIKKK